MQFGGSPSTRHEKASTNAKKEREIRQQRKREQEASNKIRRWWKSIVNYRTTLRELREDYEKSWKDEFPDDSMLNALKLKPTRVQLPQASRTFSLLQKCLRSQAPVMNCVRLISSSVSRTSCEQNVTAVMFGNPMRRYTFVRLVKRCISEEMSVCFPFINSTKSSKQLPAPPTGVSSPSLTFSTCLKLLLDLTEVRNWAFVRNSTEKVKILSQGQGEIIPLFCTALFPKIFELAQTCLLRISGAGTDYGGDLDLIASGLMTLIARSGDAASIREIILSKVPGIPRLLQKVTIKSICSIKRLWINMFSGGKSTPPTITVKKDGQQYSREEGLYLTGNLLELGRRVCTTQQQLIPTWTAAIFDLFQRYTLHRSEMTRFLDSTAAVADQFALLWEQTTVDILFHDLGLTTDIEQSPVQPSITPPSSEPQSEPTPRIVRSHSSFIFKEMRVKAPPVGCVDSTAAASLAILLVTSCLNSENELIWEKPTWSVACRLYNVLVHSWDSSSALSTVGCHPRLMIMLWSHIEMHLGSFTKFAEKLQTPLDNTDYVMGDIILMFLHCYDNLLQVVDEKEFYVLERPFKLRSVTTMISLFCKLAFRLTWDGIPEIQQTHQTPFNKQSNLLFPRIVIVSQALLQKLSHRNVRRPFADESVWQVASFTNESGFSFEDVLRYLSESLHSNPFENLFGVLRELSSEMQRSADPLERHFGDMFGDLGNLFSGLHDIYRATGSASRRVSTETQNSSGRTSTVKSDQDLLRYQVIIQPMPFLVPFKSRLEYLRFLIEKDRQANHASEIKFPVTVTRNNMLKDCFSEFCRLDQGGSVHLKAQLHVRFLNHEGLAEDGIDEGGLFKELLENVLKLAFSPELNFWLTTADNMLFPNPNSEMQKETLDELNCSANEFFKFVGRVLAKAIYEGIVVDVHFADFFLNIMLLQANTFSDLEGLDPETYRSLLQLKDVDDVEDLCLTFSVQDSPTKQTLLLRNGDHVLVTNGNLPLYLSLVANYKLNLRFKEQANCFISGFHEILPSNMLALFNRRELHQLIAGLDGSFDISELRQYTRYEGYSDKEEVIQNLWMVLAEFSDTQKADFLKFVMSSRRPPLLGFGHISPPFVIRKVLVESEKDGQHLNRLPSASTCFNLLCLPPYGTKENLSEKLLYAITSGTGFELS